MLIKFLRKCITEAKIVEDVQEYHRFEYIRFFTSQIDETSGQPFESEFKFLDM